MAEAYLRAGEGHTAADGAVEALTVVTADPYRHMLLPAMAVMIDISCWVGDPSTVEGCEDYRHAAATSGDEDRVLLADALRAVALYQQRGCDQGRHLLDRVIHRCEQRGNAATLSMLTETRSVMVRACEVGEDRIDMVAWAPVPGGVLCPCARAPWRSYLTSRLGRRRATHIGARHAARGGRP